MKQAAWTSVSASELADGRIGVLTIDAGRGNVLTRACMREMREAAAALAERPRLRALVLDHAGPHFSFGASVAEHRASDAEAMLEDLAALVRALLAHDVPLLAAVRGRCLGAGLEIVALADRVFAAPNAELGQPEVRLGVFAPLGSILLPRRIGPTAALDLLLTGRSAGAEEARAMGLVAEIADDPGAAALAWARAHLQEKSATALRFATRAARGWLAGLAGELERAHRAYLGGVAVTVDAREGIEAFLAKRAPRWEEPA